MNNKWDRNFLERCLKSAEMSKDSSTQVGAIVVGPDREVRCDGFNGFPRRIKDDERLLNRDMKLKLIIHAEQNCICNAALVGTSLRGCTMYIAAKDKAGLVWGGPPCSRCTVHVMQAGITSIVSWPQKNVPSRWHEDLQLSLKLLTEANINYREIPLT